MGLIIGGVPPHDLILDGQSVSLYAGGNPPVKVWPTSEVYEVTLDNVFGMRTTHPLVSVTVPAGETWGVRIQGTVTKASASVNYQPSFRIGVTESEKYRKGAGVDFSGTVTSANSTIAMITSSTSGTSFTGTVTIEKLGRVTVQIILDSSDAARDQFRAALTARGLGYRTVTEVPFEIELVGAGSTNEMFANCSSLTSVPKMDTSRVTSMRSMFQACSSLTSVPDMDTSQVTDMYNMFPNCSSLTSVPDMDTSQVTNMFGMFQACSVLTDGNVRLIGRHPSVYTAYMIGRSGLTREPFYDTNGNPI